MRSLPRPSSPRFSSALPIQKGRNTRFLFLIGGEGRSRYLRGRFGSMDPVRLAGAGLWEEEARPDPMVEQIRTPRHRRSCLDVPRIRDRNKCDKKEGEKGTRGDETRGGSSSGGRGADLLFHPTRGGRSEAKFLHRSCSSVPFRSTFPSNDFHGSSVARRGRSPSLAPGSFPFDWDVPFQSNPKGVPFNPVGLKRSKGARRERTEAHAHLVHVQHATCHVHRRRKTKKCSVGGLERKRRILVVDEETTWLRPHRRRVDRANLHVPWMGWCSSAKPQPRPKAIRGTETCGTHLQAADMRSDKPWEAPRRRMG